MTMIELIEKKKRNQELSDQEIKYIIDGYTHQTIPDYQMSALLMAICFNGLNQRETISLTKAMTYSGQIIDLSSIKGVKVDKHSTGGVGDKTSLVLGPMVVACQVKMAKMSGRGLGHTGGTIDKLESIPGYLVDCNKDEFIKQVQNIGIAIIGQSQELVPADKKIYALRDVTATVDCIPLIASSIMSKKIASGADTIFLDVKYGHGAFMQTKEEAIQLAKVMIDIGKAFHKNTLSAISNMNQPLGHAIGNSLEVIEAIQTLKGQGDQELLDLCLHEGSHILVQAKICESQESAYQKLTQVIKDGRAFDKFKEMVAYQGGDIQYLNHPELFEKPPYITDLPSLKSGYIKDIQAKNLGVIAMKLGGGRMVKDQDIDHRVGLILNKKIGDSVEKDELLIQVYSHSPLSEELKKEIYDAFSIIDEFVKKPKLIDKIVL